jgi:hypothetical protein
MAATRRKVGQKRGPGGKKEDLGPSLKQIASDAAESEKPEEPVAGLFPVGNKAPSRKKQSASSLLDARLSDILRRNLAEPADPEFQTDDANVQTNMEVLAATLMRDALRGDKAAREQLLNRVDGRPSVAEPVKAGDSRLEEQLDHLGVAALNDLANVEE